LLRFSCVAYRVCLGRRRFLRFARHKTASLITSRLLRCKRRVPVAPSVPSLRSSHDGVAHFFASLRCKRRVPVAPSVPSLRLSQGGVAHCFASLALHTAGTCDAVGPIASLVTGQRSSLLRFSCVANGVCLWRRRSLRLARHETASLIASHLLRCKQRVHVAPPVPSLRSSYDGVAHCFASLALLTACACFAVGPFASLVTWRRRSLLRFSCVANGVCLGRRRPLRSARHKTALLIASRLLRCIPCLPVASSVPSLRSSQDSVAHCFASHALQTECACGAVDHFALLVT